MNPHASEKEWLSFVDARSKTLEKRNTILTRREQILFFMLVGAGIIGLLIAIVAVALALAGRVQTSVATAAVDIIPAGGVAVLTSLNQGARSDRRDLSAEEAAHSTAVQKMTYARLIGDPAAMMRALEMMGQISGRP
jgi:hypothetical protein